MSIGLHKKDFRIWLLAGILFFPYVAQTVHTHYHQLRCASIDCCAAPSDGENRDDGHDPNSCPVCQFQLGYFTEPAFSAEQYIPLVREIPTHEISEQEFCPTIISYPSRGPPAHVFLYTV
ncbi:MAG: hypothetical protein LUD68_00585 [Rikenellaceae bacterium]|nr:hypothetical protein [Rikenellaceae bacterium]